MDYSPDFNHSKALSSILKTLCASKPYVELDGLIHDKEYFIVTERINGYTSMRSGFLLFTDGPNLHFRLSDGSYSMINARDYNVMPSLEPSRSRLFDDVEEAITYLDHLRDVVRSERIIQ